MKIMFLCGSLEPGKDGVGDYTRRLAGELLRQGHSVAILAIHDKFLTGSSESSQLSEGSSVPVLRMPSVTSWNERMQQAQTWVSAFGPDWLSLQYVPFSFQERGLPFLLSRRLKKISSNGRWHVMFHELWVGMDERSPFKQVCWGRVQRQLIRSMLTNLKPALTHTQVGLYQTELKKLGFTTHHLPLFGNIGREEDTNTGGTDQKLSADKLTFVLFGSIHPDAPIVEFAREAAALQAQSGKKVSLIMVGRCGAEQERWKAVWEAAGLELQILGEQEPQQISKIFQAAHVGLVTTPMLLTEKSGSVAAMLEHGLPVICVSKPWKVKGAVNNPNQPGVVEYQNGKLKTLLDTPPSQPVRFTLAAVTSQFTQSLSIL